MGAVTSVRTLVVMRHGKAEDGAAFDVERRLTEQGVLDAAAAGAWLADRGVVPERALVSAATRTVQTWEAAAQAAGWRVRPTIDDALYETGGQTVLDVVRSLPDDVDTAVVVGHNPAMASLALLFDDGEGEPDTVLEMTLGFPTSAVAVFEYDASWAALAPGGARLTGFHVGRG